MTEEPKNKVAQISAYKAEQRKQLFRGYYLVIADIFESKKPEEIQFKTAQRLRNQIELIR